MKRRRRGAGYDLQPSSQHIDPELFELFLRSGVHHDYAQRFMRAEQVDEVRIEEYL